MIKCLTLAQSTENDDRRYVGRVANMFTQPSCQRDQVFVSEVAVFAYKFEAVCHLIENLADLFSNAAVLGCIQIENYVEYQVDLICAYEKHQSPNAFS